MAGSGSCAASGGARTAGRRARVASNAGRAASGQRRRPLRAAQRARNAPLPSASCARPRETPSSASERGQKGESKLRGSREAGCGRGGERESKHQRGRQKPGAHKVATQLRGKLGDPGRRHIWRTLASASTRTGAQSGVQWRRAQSVWQCVPNENQAKIHRESRHAHRQTGARCAAAQARRPLRARGQECRGAGGASRLVLRLSGDS